MGNAESSQQASSNAQQEVKTCYYELLGVERDVTEEELKRAYKKKALQLHPDRNFQNEEWATKVFAEVQAAYEVLSDPQERAWYDSHRDSILRGASKEDISQGTGDYSSEHSIHTDTVISFMGKISQNKDFTDSENGFYTTVRNLFNVVADEEIRAASNEGIEIPEPPSFGNSSTPYQPDVKNFYQYWLGFATVKSFAWCDRYRLSDAPDRRIRRLMEKDNNKLREAGRSTFNADVREFVRFVRRRDPRYAPNNVPQQSEAERQAFLQAQSKAQSARDRAANAEKLKQHKNADWMEAELEIHEEFLSEEEESEVEEDEPEIFECILCDKTFKSEAQLKAHEKTKKHVKQVQFIQRKMRKENKELHLDEEKGPSKMTAMDDDYLPDQKEHEKETSEKASESNPAKKEQTEEEEAQSGDDGIIEDEQEKSSKTQDTKEPPSKLEEPPSEEGDEDEENSDPDHAPISAFHERLNALSLDDRESSTPAPSTPPEPKLGKAKAKRLKKAQKASEGSQSGADGASGEHVCAGCSAGFPSKTKLFQHLKENPKHAKLVPVQGGGKKKKGKK